MKPKVMIVDDDTFIVELIKSCFEEGGVDVITCTDPTNAQFLAEKEQPDLIVIDVYMEPLNGFQVAHKLKRWHNTCDIPLIFISADFDNTTAQQAFMVGGMDVLPKPLNPMTLLERAKPLIDFGKVHKLIKQLIEGK